MSKKTKVQIGDPWVENPSRRRLMIGTLATFGLAALGYGIVQQPFGQVKPVQSIYRKAELPAFAEDSRWDFLHVPIELKALPLNDVLAMSIPLGSPKVMGASSVDYARAASTLKSIDLDQIVASKGFEKGPVYDVIPTIQPYGVPLDERAAAAFVDYCIAAVDFLYESVRGLSPINIEWVVVMPGDNLGVSNNERGFIVRDVYMVSRAVITNRNKMEQTFTLNLSYSHFNGSMLYSKFDAFNRHEWWSILMGSGTTAIDAAISEPLHLTTSPVGNRHLKESRDYKGSYLAEETLVHSISHLLSNELSGRLNIPAAGEIINDVQAGAIAQVNYALIPRGIDFIRRTSIQAAFDLYMDSPQKYLEAIRS